MEHRSEKGGEVYFCVCWSVGEYMEAIFCRNI